MSYQGSKSKDPTQVESEYDIPVIRERLKVAVDQQSEFDLWGALEQTANKETKLADTYSTRYGLRQVSNTDIQTTSDIEKTFCDLQLIKKGNGLLVKHQDRVILDATTPSDFCATHIAAIADTTLRLYLSWLLKLLKQSNVLEKHPQWRLFLGVDSLLFSLKTGESSVNVLHELNAQLQSDLYKEIKQEIFHLSFWNKLLRPITKINLTFDRWGTWGKVAKYAFWGLVAAGVAAAIVFTGGAIAGVPALGVIGAAVGSVLGGSVAGGVATAIGVGVMTAGVAVATAGVKIISAIAKPISAFAALLGRKIAGIFKTPKAIIETNTVTVSAPKAIKSVAIADLSDATVDQSLRVPTDVSSLRIASTFYNPEAIDDTLSQSSHATPMVGSPMNSSENSSVDRQSVSSIDNGSSAYQAQTPWAKNWEALNGIGDMFPGSRSPSP